MAENNPLARRGRGTSKPYAAYWQEVKEFGIGLLWTKIVEDAQQRPLSTTEHRLLDGISKAVLGRLLAPVYDEANPLLRGEESLYVQASLHAQMPFPRSADVLLAHIKEELLVLVKEDRRFFSLSSNNWHILEKYFVSEKHPDITRYAKVLENTIKEMDLSAFMPVSEPDLVAITGMNLRAFWRFLGRKGLENSGFKFAFNTFCFRLMQEPLYWNSNISQEQIKSLQTGTENTNPYSSACVSRQNIFEDFQTKLKLEGELRGYEPGEIEAYRRLRQSSADMLIDAIDESEEVLSLVEMQDILWRPWLTELKEAVAFEMYFRRAPGQIAGQAAVEELTGEKGKYIEQRPLRHIILGYNPDNREGSWKLIEEKVRAQSVAI